MARLYLNDDNAVIDLHNGKLLPAFRRYVQRLTKFVNDSILLGIISSPSAVLVTDPAGTPSFSSTLPALDGSLLTNLNATQLTSGSVPGARIANDLITYAKIQNVSAASKVLGRGSAGGAGDVEEITIGTGLTMTGTTLSGSGAGSGDVVGPASSVASEIVLFDLTTGKLVKRATGSGVAHVTSGVYSASAVVEADLTLADNTTANVSTTAHGFAPKAPNDSTKFLNGVGAYAVPAGGAGGNVTSTGAVGSEPGGPASGDLYLPNNGFSEERYSGSAWIPWGPMFPFTSPVDGDFAWVNQGSSSKVTTNGGVAVVGAGTGSASNFVLRVKTAPSPPYVITAFIQPMLVHKPFQGYGLTFRQSSDGKLATFSLTADDVGTTTLTLANAKFTNETTFSANYQTLKLPNLINWFRIADDNTNRICSVSGDGINWIQIHSIGRTDFLTATQVGVLLSTTNSLTPNFGPIATLLSWKET